MTWDFSKPIVVAPTEKADQRTKNRIREHSLVPRTIRKGDQVPSSKFLQGLGTCSLFGCRNCSWTGWLPNEHFTLET